MFNVKDKRVKLRKLPEKVVDIDVKYDTDVSLIKTTILNTSDISNLQNYIPELVMATWNEDINNFNASITDEDRQKFLFRTLQGKFIPTALDSINVTFKIEGMTWHDVSHLIRHKDFSFAADCSGDKIIENRVIAQPEFIEELHLENEYNFAMKTLISLYNKAINHGVHIQDARLMLPRTMTTFYYVTGSLNACLKFIRQRIDRQVQPKADNIMAMQLLLELCKILPQLTCIISPDIENTFYTKETLTNFASKWEMPLPQNVSKLKGKIQNEDFVYDKPRDALPGNKTFVKLWKEYTAQFYKMQKEYYDSHKELVDECNTGDWR